MSAFSPSFAEVERSDDGNAIRVTKGFISMERPGGGDWSAFDALVFDVDAEADEPVPLYVEIRDAQTTGYWTRVNLSSVVPPGKSTFTLPLNQQYVGEKSRPGRNLLLDQVTRLVLSIHDNPPGAVTFSNMRLVQNEKPPLFEGLFAFDLGPETGPVMDGFTPITPATQYTAERGYGLQNARIWRALDMLQPEPLYQDSLAIESGGLRVDLPNGKYRVMINLNHPGGFWGENQIFHQRTVLANGVPVVEETLNAEQFYDWYFRFWDIDDMPTDNTFDKYQKDAYREKVFDVDVSSTDTGGGSLFLEFRGSTWANCVSAVVIYPVNRAEEGEKFLEYVIERRRFYFDNYFKRVLHQGTGDPSDSSLYEGDFYSYEGLEALVRGYIVFRRDFMEDIYYNDTPREEERITEISAEAFAGEYEPVTFSLVPLSDRLGKASVKVSDLTSEVGTIPASAIEVGYVSYRLSRIAMDGSVYTIAPRLIMPPTKNNTSEVEMPNGITRTFWLTVKTPSDATPGTYHGKISVTTNVTRVPVPSNRRMDREQPTQALNSQTFEFKIPFTFRVRKGTLDEADIPVGPWGHDIRLPWREDAASREFYQKLRRASLEKIREYGFNCVTGIPTIPYRGFRDGKPVLDFAQADADMKLLRELGYMMVCDYGAGLQGLNKYFIDERAMRDAGFTDYSEFIKAIYTAIQEHADANDWLPVYYYLADEPLGEDLLRSILNAEAYKKAFPTGPPFFTVATSYDGRDPDDPHLKFSLASHTVSWNTHNAEAVRLLHEGGGNWAFYNGSNRWTMGDYMYKCVREYDMKFRLVWHYNCAAGNPYYALDSREDDYAWANASPDGTLIPSVEFERLRAGLNDYRRLITLERLVRETGDEAGRQLIEERMQSFRLGQRDHEKIFPFTDWQEFRRKVSDAIERLR